MVKVIQQVWCWLTHRPAWVLLTASDEKLGEYLPQRFARAWSELMLLSLLWGLAAVGLWGTTWRVFGEFTGIPLVQVAVVLVAMVLCVYRRAILAMAEILVGPDLPSRSLAGCAIVVALALMLLGMRSYPYWHHGIPPLYVVLVLSPLWGAWAMLIVPKFCRPGAGTDSAVKAFVEGCGPLQAAICLAMPMAATIVYFNYLPWTQLWICAAAILAAIGGGCLLCRQTGGLTRKALLADNLLTQMVFILAYLANKW